MKNISRSDLEQLVNVTSILSSKINTDILVHTIIRHASRVVKSEASSLLLIDKKTDKLYFNRAVREKSYKIKDMELKSHEGIAGWVVKEKRPIIVNDIKKHPVWSANIEKKSKFKTRNILAVPIMIKGEIIGVVEALNKRNKENFTEADLQIFEAFASQAAISIENARLLEDSQQHIEDLEKAMQMYHQAREKSITDPLTGLYNHGYFMEQLNREFHSFKRYGNVFSVIFLDIDFFKKINDTYGHQAGNQVLIDVAQQIKSNCRQTDLSARYGGDEMAILFINTDADQAYFASEKLRKSINKINIPDQQEHIHLCSGIAQINRADISVNKFLERVDKALYTAKVSGRNKSCRWETPDEKSSEKIKHKIHIDNEIEALRSSINQYYEKVTPEWPRDYFKKRGIDMKEIMPTLLKWQELGYIKIHNSSDCLFKSFKPIDKDWKKIVLD